MIGALAGAAALLAALVRFTSKGRPVDAPAAAADAATSGTTLGAVIDRLLPGGEGMPTASQAGVAAYVEGELAKPTFATPGKAIRHAMKALDQATLARGGKSFATLSHDQQDEMIAALSTGTLHTRDPGSGAIFQILLSLALEGYFGHPRHGGNTNAVAWHAIHFDSACQMVHPMPAPSL